MGTKNYNRDRIIEAAVLFSLFYLPAYLFQSGNVDGEAFNSPFYNIQLNVMLIPQILLILYMIYRDERLGFSHFGIVKIHMKDFPFFILALLTTAGVVLSLQMLFQFLPGLMEDVSFEWRLRNPAVLPLVLISSLITGYSEELFFRSYLFTRVEQTNTGRWNALFAVNLIFSLGHLYEGAAGGINAFVLGCLFSFIYLKKRNIHIPALIHGLYNFTALLLSLYL